MQTTTTPSIAFDDLGDGPRALLYMPGWCSNRTAFRPLLPLAAVRHRALALDWRGHGGSEPAATDFGETELVDDALAVIRAAGVEQVIPVALAHAGWVGIELRRRLGPERVPAIVLVDWMPLGAPAPFFDALAGLQGEHWADVRAGLFSMWTTGLDIPALDVNIKEMAEYEGPMWARAGREISRSFVAHGEPLTLLDALSPSCPTLHVYAQPADDEFLAAQERYATTHPWLEVRRLDARSHFPMFETPDELQATIDEFAASAFVVDELVHG